MQRTHSNSFEDLQKRIHSFCEARDWAQFHDPKNLAISLNLEAAEVLELFQWTQDNMINPALEKNLKHELADVLYWLLLIADKHSINLLEALSEKITINEEKYPVAKAKGKSTKYTQL